MIRILEPDLSGNELKYVTECVQSGWISSKGDFVASFEKHALQDSYNRQSLATANGTVALHLALVALGIGAGDEVIVPNMTFGATINAILHAGATPVLVDVCRQTWNMDCLQVKAAMSKKTKAILPVALFGNPSGIRELCDWAASNGILSIIDAAEAVGATISGQDIGNYGDAVTYSYFGNKTITTGEGGAVIFKCPEIYQKAVILRDHGMRPDRRYHHEVVGFNYRMTNLQAAVGVAQYERLQNILDKRKGIVDRYCELIAEVCETQYVVQNCVSSNWVFAIKLEKAKRQKLELALKNSDIEYRRAFELMSEQPAFAKYCRAVNTPVAQELFDGLLLLPTHSGLSNLDIRKICDVVNNGVI